MEPSARNIELEAAALANLDDLDSWRVYADWLLSVGDPRGELVSLHLHQANAYRSERVAMADQLRAREQAYVDAWHAWAHDLDLLEVEPRFRRGFVESIKGPLSQLEGKLDQLFERDPIQRLNLREVEDDALVRLCERRPPWFERLRYLCVSGRVGPAGAAALAKNPLPKLERLNLLGNQIEAVACQHLAGLDTRVLGALTLTANLINDDALASLLGSKQRGQWRQLYLTGNPITAQGLARLADTDGFERLEALYLRNVNAKLADFEPLLDSAKLAKLTTLEVSSAGSWSARALSERMRARWGAGYRLR
ncbi:hypothetical protein DB30_02024 [Enhygromyxa salina]|uniref:Leucine Rich repeats (2 copies) n=1 Tax=Enhygromyxa salina TaxID=215803 RepID=A0A0C1Z3D2_9BACT|nr:hypothetical protein [Enhygromyxa salina]KIG12109.1 hypothetical protein DB30_02024 [Enhygromyxa salina]